MAEKLEKIEKVIDEKLTAAEMYARRPRKWWLYLLIVLILFTLIGWSSSSIEYEGLTVTGRSVAQGVVSGITHPDLKLMFGTGDTDVPYLLLQTMAIAVLGTLFGAILAIPFAFLASTNILPKPIAYIFRIVILLIRTIPSLVWALMWIRVTGPGAACGVNPREPGRHGLHAVPEDPLRRHPPADGELHLHDDLSLRHQSQGRHDARYRRRGRHRRLAGAVPEQPPLGDGRRLRLGLDGPRADHRIPFHENSQKACPRRMIP